jgi:hypothetical protein
LRSFGGKIRPFFAFFTRVGKRYAFVWQVFARKSRQFGCLFSGNRGIMEKIGEKGSFKRKNEKIICVFQKL